MIEKYRVLAVSNITHRLPDKKEMKNVEKVMSSEFENVPNFLKD